MSTHPPVAWPPQEDVRHGEPTFGDAVLAPWDARVAAACVDCAIVVGVAVAVAAISGWTVTGFIVLLAIALVAGFVNSVLLVRALDGASVGKWLCGMTVVDFTGEPIGLSRALARYLFGSIGGTYGAIDALMTMGRKRRSLTDRITDTRVIQTAAFPRRWPWRGLGWLLLFVELGALLALWLAVIS